MDFAFALLEKTKSKLHDVMLNLRNCFNKAAVEKNVTLRSDDQERREIGSAQVVEISSDAKRLDRLIPRSARLICLTAAGCRT